MAEVPLYHTLITGYRRTDHANRNGLDNQRHNLRECSQSQNMANRGPNRRVGTSSFKGVYWFRPARLWVAKIEQDGQRRLRYFHDEQEAARMYDVWAVELFGEFARLNFPAA